MGDTRCLTYAEAIGEALVQAMEANPKVLLMGEGVDDPKGTFGTTLPAFRKFGPARVFDTPLSEQAITGIGVGAALMGVPCVQVHLRSEFLLLAMDQVVNHAAKWRYMTAGKFSVPLTIRCIVGRGWGQAAQHSQSFHGMLASVPGLKVILPTTPYDAKGMMLEAVRDPNPVIVIEHRWLHGKKGEVPAEPYYVPLDQARVARVGADITCVAVSLQTLDALAAAEILAGEGIEMEVVDLRSALPIDRATILRSIRKTGRLLVTDIAHKTMGISAEIAAFVVEEAWSSLRAHVARVALPDAPTPCAAPL